MDRDWLRVFRRPLRYLKFLGINYGDVSTKFQVVVLVFKHMFFVDFSLISTLMYFTTFKDLEDFSEAFGMLPTFVGEFLKTINFIFKKRQIELLMKSLQDLIEHDEWIETSKGRKLQRRIAQIDKIFKLFLIGVFLSLTFSSFVPFTSHKVPYKMWLPWDYNQNEIAFWVMAFYQVVIGFIVAPAVIILDTIPAFVMSFVTGLIEELNDRLEQITLNSIKKQIDGKSSRCLIDKFSLDELEKCIVIQQKIKSLVKEIGDVFGAILWVQGFMSTLILCTTSFSLTVVSCFCCCLHFPNNI